MATSDGDEDLDAGIAAAQKLLADRAAQAERARKRELLATLQAQVAAPASPSAASTTPRGVAHPGESLRFFTRRRRIRSCRSERDGGRGADVECFSQQVALRPERRRAQDCRVRRDQVRLGRLRLRGFRSPKHRSRSRATRRRRTMHQWAKSLMSTLILFSRRTLAIWTTSTSSRARSAT